MQGIVKKKVQEKGFGFISVEGAEDMFFHMSACNERFNDINEGMSVEFDTEDTPKGKRAINVVMI